MNEKKMATVIRTEINNFWILRRKSDGKILVEDEFLYFTGQKYVGRAHKWSSQPDEADLELLKSRDDINPFDSGDCEFLKIHAEHRHTYTTETVDDEIIIKLDRSTARYLAWTLKGGHAPDLVYRSDQNEAEASFSEDDSRRKTVRTCRHRILRKTPQRIYVQAFCERELRHARPDELKKSIWLDRVALEGEGEAHGDVPCGGEVCFTLQAVQP